MLTALANQHVYMAQSDFIQTAVSVAGIRSITLQHLTTSQAFMGALIQVAETLLDLYLRAIKHVNRVFV